MAYTNVVRAVEWVTMVSVFLLPDIHSAHTIITSQHQIRSVQITLQNQNEWHTNKHRKSPTISCPGELNCKILCLYLVCAHIVSLNFDFFLCLQHSDPMHDLVGNGVQCRALSRPVLRRSYLSGGQGVRAWSSGKTKRLCSMVALPKG